VELLEGVVGEDDGAGTLRDAQDEGIAPPDGPGRRGDHLAVEHRFAQRLAFGLVDAVFERCVDDDGDAAPRVLFRVGAYRLVELRQARERSPFRGQVGPVHDNVVGFSQWRVATDRPAPAGAARHFRWPDWPIRSD
jgi:hypothetical protein